MCKLAFFTYFLEKPTYIITKQIIIENNKIIYNQYGERALDFHHNRRTYLIYTIVIAVVLFVIYTIYQNPESPIKLIYRTTGIFGYLLVFSAIVSSEYMYQIKRLFGQTFLKFHHNLIKLASILIVLHPVSFALDVQSFKVFLPVFYPPVTFLELAGRPALYLFIIAIITAIYRKKIPKNWKKIHLLNYLAFFLVSIHALLIGTDFSSTGMKILSFIMMAIVVGIFVHKRLKKSRMRR